MLRTVLATLVLGILVTPGAGAPVPPKKDDRKSLKLQIGKVQESQWLGADAELFVLRMEQEYYSWYQTLTGLKRGAVRIDPVTDERKEEPGDIPLFKQGTLYLGVL